MQSDHKLTYFLSVRKIIISENLDLSIEFIFDCFIRILDFTSILYLLFTQIFYLFRIYLN